MLSFICSRFIYSCLLGCAHGQKKSEQGGAQSVSCILHENTVSAKSYYKKRAEKPLLCNPCGCIYFYTLLVDTCVSSTMTCSTAV